MSSPLNDQALAATTRLKQAANAAGNYPQVATALAGSDLNSSQINMVGGFIKGLDTSTLTQLADASGATVPLSGQQQDQLNALGQTYQNIQGGKVNAPQQQTTKTDPRNWLEKSFDWVATHAANTMQSVVGSTPMHYLFEGMNDAVKAVKYPLALLSNSFDGGQQSNDIQRAMKMEGYDPSSTKSYLAFMFNKSDSVFHDLSGVRSQYGDAMVDLAIKQHEDPAAFSTALAAGHLGTIDGKAAADVANSADFQKAAQLVDQHGISPGRDLANLITFGHTNNAAFHILSGALDATFDIAADPTLIGGKVFAGMKALDYAGRAVKGLEDASRFSKVTGQAVVVNKLVKAGDAITQGRLRSGIENALDSEGMKQLVLSPQTAVGQQASGFIQAVNDWRALSAKTGDEAAQQAAQKFADLSTRYKRWMPFFDEVNGKQVLSKAEETDPASQIDGVMTDKTGEKHFTTTTKGPIENVQDFADYLGSTQGLLRMGNGVAAKGAIMLPGRVGLTTRLAARNAARRVENGLSKDAQDFVIDHSKPGKNLPNEAEESIQERLDDAYGQDAKTGDAIFNELRRGTADGKGWNPIKVARAKFDQTSRRWSTFMPTTRNLDLNGADAIDNVRRVARMYLTKGHSDALTSAFANGNTGVRRQIYNSIIEQSFHASGLSRSEDGRAFMDQWRADQDALDKRAYGLEGTDVIQTPAGPRHVALVPSQISQSVKVPDFKQLSYIASKAAAAGWMARTFGYFRAGIHSPTVDAIIGLIKMGWITTPSGGGRNAFDEVVGHIAQNQAPEMLKGRALYTGAKTDAKALTIEDQKRAAAVSGHLGAKIPAHLRGAANSVNHAIFGSVLGKLASFTRSGFVTDPEELRYAKELIEDEKAGLASEAVAGVHIPREAFGNDATVALHGNGVAAERFGFDREKARTHQFDGWKQVELDGGAGLDAWVSTMHQYFADPLSPAHVALRGLVEGGGPEAAVSNVIDYMGQPAMKHFIEDSELLNTVPGSEKQVASAAERDAATEDYAQRLVSQVGLMLRGKGRPLTDDALVNEAREWKSQAVRATAAKRADDLVAGHADLVQQAEDAHGEAQRLTAEHQAIKSQPTPPDDEHLSNAAEAARQARNKASYLAKRVDTHARTVQAHTLNADHAYADNAHVDDQDIRAYLRDTGQTDRAVHDPLQGGAPVVDATIHPVLAERLLAGDIPDRTWLKNNVPDHQRPANTVKPTWAPINPAQGNAAIRLAEGWTGLLTKAFNQVVEKPVQALSRNPMRMSAYVQARKTLAPYEQHLIENGFSPEIAEQSVRRMANSHADQLVIKSVDNATVQTQFEMMSRNWWAFSRAQGDWLRRWSRIVHDNPTVIRKAQIALYGGMSAGMIDKDPTSGQLTFVYPGSGYVINALTKLGQGLGLPGLANIPVMPDLRSNLTYLNPSADNPLGYSSTPVVSVPFHLLSAMMGSHYPLLQASADKIVNGQLGAGRAWYANFMPSYVNRIYDGVFKDPNNNPADAHSQLGSAMHSAIINLAAAGRLDDPRLGYDPSYRQQFLNDLQTQTKTHMAMRALLGFFLPASPTSPTEDVADANGNWVNRVSFTDHQAGIASLTDEARQVFGNMDYASASAYWAKYHPDKLPFEQGYDPETQAGSRDAVASATMSATKWMQDNPDFVNKFGGANGLAVYFMPAGQPGSTGGQFSQLAYNAQVEQGMRKYLSTTDQFNGLLVKNAEKMYFDVKKQYDDGIATATANSDKASAKSLADAWSQQKDIIYATNPLLAQKFVGFASNGIMDTEVVNQLNDMLSPENIGMTTQALGPDQVAGVAQMLLALRNYSAAADGLKGQSSPEATAARAALKADYDQKITQITTALPGLGDLANGAFKAPN